MVVTLEQAIERVGELPEAEQERLGALLIEELEQIARDAAFDELIASRPDILAQFVADTRADVQAGLVGPLRVDYRRGWAS